MPGLPRSKWGYIALYPTQIYFEELEKENSAVQELKARCIRQGDEVVQQKAQIKELSRRNEQLDSALTQGRLDRVELDADYTTKEAGLSEEIASLTRNFNAAHEKLQCQVKHNEQQRQVLHKVLQKHTHNLETDFPALSAQGAEQVESSLSLDDSVSCAGILLQDLLLTATLGASKLEELTHQLGGVLDEHAVQLKGAFESLSVTSKGQNGSELVERVEHALGELLVEATSLQQALSGKGGQAEEVSNA